MAAALCWPHVHPIDSMRVVSALAMILTGCRPPTPADPHAQSLPTMPGPTHTDPAPGRAALNDACVRCHPLQSAEWSASQHRSAHTDPDYQRAVALEREDFCQSCHAPEAAPVDEPAAAEGAIGVACVTCHVPHGTEPVLAVPGTRTTEAHALARVDAFAGVDACAGCHEFAFPRQPDVAMQATVTEHAQSAFAATACADCHMPWLGEGRSRHRDHAFAASRSPEMLRSAVVVDARRGDGGIVELRLTPGHVGHAFPTGDLFRRLWVDAEVVDADGDAIAYDGRALGRRFARSGGHMIGDDRPGAPALRGGVAEVVFDLGELGATHAIRWRVMHQRVELPLEGDEAKLFGETLVTRGELPPRGTPP
jgi:hypothetical protein